MPISKKLSLKRRNKLYIRLGFLFLIIGIVGLSIPLLSLGFLNDFTLLNTLAKEDVTPDSEALNSNFLKQNGSLESTRTTEKILNDKNRVSISKISVNM